MVEKNREQQGASRAAAHYEAGQLRIRSDRDGVVHTIGLSGELDLATVDEAERELARVEATDALSIILDLSSLSFIDSTGVRFVLNAHARSRGDSNRLAMLRGSPPVQRVFEICGISNLLPFAD